MNGDIERQKFVKNLSKFDKNDVVNASKLLKDMNTKLTFEGRPPTDKDNQRLRKLLLDLCEALAQFNNTQIWPHEVVPFVALHKYLIVAHQMGRPDLIQGLEDILDEQSQNDPDSDTSEF